MGLGLWVDSGSILSSVKPIPGQFRVVVDGLRSDSEPSCTIVLSVLPWQSEKGAAKKQLNPE